MVTVLLRYLQIYKTGMYPFPLFVGPNLIGILVVLLKPTSRNNDYGPLQALGSVAR